MTEPLRIIIEESEGSSSSFDWKPGYSYVVSGKPIPDSDTTTSQETKSLDHELQRNFSGISGQCTPNDIHIKPSGGGGGASPSPGATNTEHSDEEGRFVPSLSTPEVRRREMLLPPDRTSFCPKGAAAPSNIKFNKFNILLDDVVDSDKKNYNSEDEDEEDRDEAEGRAVVGLGVSRVKQDAKSLAAMKGSNYTFPARKNVTMQEIQEIQKSAAGPSADYSPAQAVPRNQSLPDKAQRGEDDEDGEEQAVKKEKVFTRAGSFGTFGGKK